MILDRNWNAKKQELTISYIDQNGHRKFFSRRMSQFPTWDFSDTGTSENWDGRKIQRMYKSTIDGYKPSEFDILEYMYESPLKPEFEAIRYPKLYTTDIETEISNEFPDPGKAEQKVTTISVASQDYSVIVLAIRPFSDDQLESFKNSYLDYIRANEFASKHCDLSKVRVLYQYFSSEEDMLKHFFEKMIPKMEVVAGWNYLKFDWQYLTNRLKRLFGDKEARSIIYRSSPTGEIKMEKVIDNKQNEVRLTVPRHVAIMDYMELVEKYDRTLPFIESLRLDWIAKEAVGARKIKYQGNLQQLYERDYDKYVFYNAVDSLLIQMIDQRLKTLNVMFVYSAFTMQPLMKCLSPIALTTSMVWDDFYATGLHCVWEDKPTGVKEAFGGGYVKDPRVGWHPWVACYDFASLYPSQIQTCNLSFENYMQNYVTGWDGSKCPVPWTPEELKKYEEDPNYFVSVNGNVYKNDKDYAFKRMQKRTKAKRDFFKYRGQKMESELLAEIDVLISGNSKNVKSFHKSVQDWLDEQKVDIYKMTKEELQEFRKDVVQRRDEDVLLDLSTKLLGNGAYGASSHPAFFWYNINLASDITAESRETTGYMERKFDEFFHGEWWDRTDLHTKFGIQVDPSKKDWYSSFSSTVYGDTDSTTDCKLISYEKGADDYQEIMFSELFDKNKNNNYTVLENGTELVTTDTQLLNWTPEKKLEFMNVKYIMRHKVRKPKWKLKTKSGKEIIVTDNHSMMVMRDNKLTKVLPSEILPTDKVVTVNTNK